MSGHISPWWRIHVSIDQITQFIGSNVGGISEIINSDNIGILVPPGDPNKLADALEAAILKTWDYQLISSHVRKYSWQNISKKIKYFG